MGPLGLSGSLFFVLLVLDFYHPTNRDLYLVVAVAVAVAVVMAVGRIFGWRWRWGVFLGSGGGGAYFLVKFGLFSKLFGSCF